MIRATDTAGVSMGVQDKARGPDKEEGPPIPAALVPCCVLVFAYSQILQRSYSGGESVIGYAIRQPANFLRVPFNYRGAYLLLGGGNSAGGYCIRFAGIS